MVRIDERGPRWTNRSVHRPGLFQRPFAHRRDQRERTARRRRRSGRRSQRRFHSYAECSRVRVARRRIYGQRRRLQQHLRQCDGSGRDRHDAWTRIVVRRSSARGIADRRETRRCRAISTEGERRSRFGVTDICGTSNRGIRPHRRSDRHSTRRAVPNVVDAGQIRVGDRIRRDHTRHVRREARCPARDVDNAAGLGPGVGRVSRSLRVQLYRAAREQRHSDLDAALAAGIRTDLERERQDPRLRSEQTRSDVHDPAHATERYGRTRALVIDTGHGRVRNDLWGALSHRSKRARPAHSGRCAWDAE